MLEREVGDKIRLKLYRPVDILDEAGTLATQHYGLKPKKAIVDTVSGKDESEVFLGAVIACGARTQRIDYFDPGLSVEYELVRSIRTVSNAKKKVLGVVSTDLKMLGGFEQGMGRPQMRPEWLLVQEWKKQYEVREVNLDVAVGKDVDVLVAPQPSRLNNKQLENFHNYIWEGRPTLIMEDPLPAFSDPALGSSQPKQPRQNPMRGEPQEPAEKGDLNPLLKSLGIRYEGDQVVWSDYNPSHEFRNALPRSIVWTLKEKNGILDAPVTSGVGSLLLLWPGKITEAPDKNSELTVKTLVKPIPSVNWGTHNFNELFGMSPFGMMAQTPEQFTPSAEPAPAIAVEITGKMKRAYALPAEEKKDEKKDEKKTKDDKDKKDEPKKEEPPKGLGDLSANSIHVIFVADTDFATNQFFDFYRNENNKWSKDEFKFLEDLRNVQFLSNAIDSLVGDEDLITLRTRRPIRRPHDLLEEVEMKRQKTRNDAITAAQTDATNKIKQLNDDFQKRLSKIDENSEEDENVRAQMKEQVQKSAEGNLKLNIDRINQKLDEQIRQAKIEEQREISRARWGVRAGAFGTPTVILLCLALTVFFLRRRGERLIVPESRKRSVA